MQIYFDDILIDPDNYMSYEDNFSSHEDQFFLGSTASMNAKLQIPLSVYREDIQNVIIINNGITIATLKIDEVSIDDDNIVTLKLVDVLTHTAKPLDISSLIGETGVSARDLYKYICNTYNIPFADEDFDNSEMVIHSYDSNLTGRDYLGMIGEIAGGNIKTTPQGSIYIDKYLRNSENLIKNSNINSGDGNYWQSYSTFNESTRTLTRSTTATTENYITHKINGLKSNQIYTLSFYAKSNNYVSSMETFCFNANTQGIRSKNHGRPTTDFTRYIWSFTTASDVDYSTNAQIRFDNNGSTQSGTEATLTIKDVMLFEGEYTEDQLPDYMEFGKTFEPDIDQEILSYNDVDNYKLSEQITIERVVYDDGVTVPKKSSEDETLYTLYLDTNNLFLQNMNDSQFQKICDNIIGLSFYNIEIPNCSKFPWDNGKLAYFSKEDNEKIIIMNNYTRSFMGDFVGSYKTNIEGTIKNETRVISNEENIRKLTTEINQVDNRLTIQAQEIHGNDGTGGLVGQISNLSVDVEKIQSLFQITGGSNVIKNSQFLLTDPYWTFNFNDSDPISYHTNLGEGYNSSLIGFTVAIANIVLRNCKTISTNDNISNIKTGAYNLNFYIDQDANTTSNIKLIGKNTGEILIDETFTGSINRTNKSYDITCNDTSYTLSIESNTTSEGYTRIYDLMMNSGSKKNWEPAKDEIYSTILRMSQLGLQVYSSGANILTLMTSDGFQIRACTSNNGNLVIGRIISNFNNTGISTETISMVKAIIDRYVQENITIDSIIHHIEYFQE